MLRGKINKKDMSKIIAGGNSNPCEIRDTHEKSS
jgi:hypothetical protein